jgi:hypothetical protein
MWRGYDQLLARYYNSIVTEWVARGYNNSMSTLPINIDLAINQGFPLWLGRPSFHAAHRSNLLHKLPGWYKQFGWTEPNNLEYEWS